MSDRLFDAREGRRRAERGQERVARANGSSVAMIARGFLEHLRAIHPQPGSMDTLRASGFEMPPVRSFNAIGSAIGGLSRAGLIVPVGVTRGSRPEAHRAKICLWRLAEDLEGGGA